ncbi:ribonuclease H-like domain-containing protein [Kalaharituber pfeilii]|nr:ribonuclease H-like domain-containing protein [Kalaharituber pfeilii]
MEEEGWGEVYTDGSRIKERSGAGVVEGGRVTSIYLGERATVNDAELLAIGEAMRSSGETLELTDSMVAVRNIQKIAEGHPTHQGASQKVRERWEERGDEDVAIMWVKGHKGIKGNESADRAARIGTALQYEEEVITESEMIQQAKRGRAAERDRLGMSYCPLRRLGHRVSKIAGLIGGKGLKAWRHKLGEAGDASCRWCGEGDETYAHLMGECRTWRRRWPGGDEELRRPKESRDGDPLQGVLDLLEEPTWGSGDGRNEKAKQGASYTRYGGQATEGGLHQELVRKRQEEREGGGFGKGKFVKSNRRALIKYTWLRTGKGGTKWRRGISGEEVRCNCEKAWSAEHVVFESGELERPQRKKG